MSRIPLPQSKGVPPKTGGIPRPSESFRPTASSTMREAGSKSQIPGSSRATMSEMTSKSSIKKTPADAKEKKEKDINVKFPALSVFKQKPTDQTELERLRKRTARRNAPQGEDIKSIKEIMKNIRHQEITVHEFVGLVAPYTADNGTILRTILATELSNFRTLARKIYDNMTRDVSDVLANEHIQLTETSKEKHAQYSDKMMRAIDQIYEDCPEFDFDKYYTDPNYLHEIFPLSTQHVMDESEEQTHLRQEAYHRMMWLRSEGERLSAENKKLQARLQELKKRQKDEMRRAATINKQNEEKRMDLEVTQETLQEQLVEMNNSIEVAIVHEERGLLEENVEQIPPAPEIRKPPSPIPRPKTRQPENWNVQAAAAIEESRTTEVTVADASRISIATTKSSTGAIPKVFKPKKEKKKRRTRQRVPQDADPFHYSPPRTPPEYAQQRSSPFHYSPQRSPRWAARQEQLSQAEGLETTRVTTTVRTVDQPNALSGLPRFRRSQGPQDSWRGFT